MIPRLSCKKEHDVRMRIKGLDPWVPFPEVHKMLGMPSQFTEHLILLKMMLLTLVL